MFWSGTGLLSIRAWIFFYCSVNLQRVTNVMMKIWVPEPRNTDNSMPFLEAWRRLREQASSQIPPGHPPGKDGVEKRGLTIAGANGIPFRRGLGSTAQLQLTEIKGKTPAAAQTNDTLCHSCSVLNEYDVWGRGRGHMVKHRKERTRKSNRCVYHAWPCLTSNPGWEGPNIRFIKRSEWEEFI